jgi:hypothetical protein
VALSSKTAQHGPTRGYGRNRLAADFTICKSNSTAGPHTLPPSLTDNKPAKGKLGSHPSASQVKKANIFNHWPFLLAKANSPFASSNRVCPLLRLAGGCKMGVDLRYLFASVAATAAFTFLALAFPTLNRIFTVPALVIFAGLTLYFLWPEIGGFPKDRRGFALIGMIVSAVGFAGFAGWYLWPTAEDPKATDAGQPASLYLQWRWARLPTIMPASGVIMTMPNVAQAELGAQPILLSPRPGTPGEKVSWGGENRTYAGIYRCEITNYADFPIFNLAMTFKTEFFPEEKDHQNPNAGSRSSSPIETYDRPIVIDKLDPKETYSFYAYSDSRMWVHIWLPENVTYLRDRSTSRETAHLLPQSDKLADLFPVVINATQAAPAQQKPIPTTRTVRELRSFYEGRTRLQADAFMADEKGKQIETEGKVENIDTGMATLEVGRETHNGMPDYVECRFDPKWNTKLATFRAGDHMKIRGIIGPNQNGAQIYLQDCEII